MNNYTDLTPVAHRSVTMNNYTQITIKCQRFQHPGMDLHTEPCLFLCLAADNYDIKPAQ